MVVGPQTPCAARRAARLTPPQPRAWRARSCCAGALWRASCVEMHVWNRVRLHAIQVDELRFDLFISRPLRCVLPRLSDLLRYLSVRLLNASIHTIICEA